MTRSYSNRFLRDTVVIALDLLLCGFDGIGQCFVFDLLSSGIPKVLNMLIRRSETEQSHQIVLQRDVELDSPGISLTPGTTTQLIINIVWTHDARYR